MIQYQITAVWDSGTMIFGATARNQGEAIGYARNVLAHATRGVDATIKAEPIDLPKWRDVQFTIGD